MPALATRPALPADPAARPADPGLLKAAASDPSVELRREALRKLANRTTEAPFPDAAVRAKLFAAALEDADPRIRSTALEGLLSVGPEAKAALPRLIADLEAFARNPSAVPIAAPQGQPPAHLQAMRVLMRIGPDAATAAPVLSRILRIPQHGQAYDGSPQLLAAKALAKLGKAGLAELTACLESDRLTAATACHALEHLGPAAAPAATALAKGLDGEDQFNVLPRLMALAAIGPVGREALPAVQAAATVKKQNVYLNQVRGQMAAIVAQRLQGVPPPKAAGGYKIDRPPPAELAADTALAREILAAAGPASLDATAGGHPDQTAHGAAHPYARLGDFDRAVEVLGPFGNATSETGLLVTAGVARARAGDDDTAARYLDRALLRCLQSQDRSTAGHPWHAEDTAMAYLRLGDYRSYEPLLAWPEVARKVVDTHLEEGRIADAARAASLQPDGPAGDAHGVGDKKVSTLMRLGTACLRAGDRAAGADHFARAFDVLAVQQHVLPDPLNEVIDGLVRCGRSDLAVDKVSALKPFQAEARANGLRRIAGRLAAARDFPGAAKAAERITSSFEGPQMHHLATGALCDVAEAAVAAGDKATATKLFDQAATAASAAMGPSEGGAVNDSYAWALGVSQLAKVAKARLDAGDKAGAKQTLAKAVDAVKKAPPDAMGPSGGGAGVTAEVAALLAGAGDPAAAGDLVRLVPDARRQVEAWLAVARARRAGGDKDGAARSLAEAEKAVAAIADAAERQAATSQVAAAKQDPQAQGGAVLAGGVQSGDAHAELERIGQLARRGDFKKALDAARATPVDVRGRATFLVAQQQLFAGDFAGAADTIAVASPGGFDWAELYVPVLTGAAKAGRLDAAEKVVAKMGSSAPAAYRRLAIIRADAGDKAGASALLEKAAAAASRQSAAGSAAGGTSRPAAAGVPPVEQVANLKTRLRITGDRAAVLAACRKLLSDAPPRADDPSGYVPRLAALQAAAGDARSAWAWVRTIPEPHARRQATAALLDAVLTRVAGPPLNPRPERTAGLFGTLD